MYRAVVQELQRGLTAVAALMPGSLGVDDGATGSPGVARQRPAVARALRCIAAVTAELQVCVSAMPCWACCPHCSSLDTSFLSEDCIPSSSLGFVVGRHVSEPLTRLLQGQIKATHPPV